jgi:hypothetical protein
LAVSDLYDTDFFAWTQQQAAAIREGDWDAVDREHVAEEIEDMWKTEAHQMWKDFRELMVWLVAWSYSPESRRAHPWWYARIVGLRTDIEIVLRGYPHLRHELYQDRHEAYAYGREVGAEELGVPPETLCRDLPVDSAANSQGRPRIRLEPFFRRAILS